MHHNWAELFKVVLNEQSRLFLNLEEEIVFNAKRDALGLGNVCRRADDRLKFPDPGFPCLLDNRFHYTSYDPDTFDNVRRW